MGGQLVRCSHLRTIVRAALEVILRVAQIVADSDGENARAEVDRVCECCEEIERVLLADKAEHGD